MCKYEASIYRDKDLQVAQKVQEQLESPYGTCIAKWTGTCDSLGTTLHKTCPECPDSTKHLAPSLPTPHSHVHNGPSVCCGGGQGSRHLVRFQVHCSRTVELQKRKNGGA